MVLASILPFALMFNSVSAFVIVRVLSTIKEPEASFLKLIPATGAVKSPDALN